MSRNPRNSLHAIFNKHHKCPVALLVNFTITFGKKYGQLRVLDSTTRATTSTRFSHKTTVDAISNPKVTNRWFTLILSVTLVLRDVY